MARTLHAFAMLFALALSPIALADMLAQGFSYTGGTPKGIKVKTDTSSVIAHDRLDPVGPESFEPLAGSELTVHVNAGDSDLFVYEIEAKCSIRGGSNDYVDLQARVNDVLRFGVVGGGPAILQPQSIPTSLVLCVGPVGLPSPKVAASWVTRLGGGDAGFDYTFTIWWRAVDRVPYEAKPGVIADLSHRIVKLTRYN